MRNKDGEICKNCGHYVIWLSSGWHHAERSQGQNTTKLDHSKKATITFEPQCKEPGCNCNNPEPVE